MLQDVKPIRRLSRSTYCAKLLTGTKSRCRRLAEHNGDCRPTLASPVVVAPPKAAKARKASSPTGLTVVINGVTYALVPVEAPKAARRPKVRVIAEAHPAKTERRRRQAPRNARRAKAAPQISAER